MMGAATMLLFTFLILKATCLPGYLYNYFSCFNDNEIFLRNSWSAKGTKHYFQPRSLSEILTVANLLHAASKIWTFTEREFRHCWMTWSIDNHYTIVLFMASFSQNYDVTNKDVTNSLVTKHLKKQAEWMKIIFVTLLMLLAYQITGFFVHQSWEGAGGSSCFCFGDSDIGKRKNLRSVVFFKCGGTYCVIPRFVWITEGDSGVDVAQGSRMCVFMFE